MMVHHLPTAQKEALFAEAQRVLSADGSFFLLDFNAPATEWQAIVARAVARAVARFEQIDDNESFDEFVDTWAMWQAYQKDYVTRCLERAARRRRRKMVPEQQLSLL